LIVLDAIGFTWDVLKNEAKWESNYQKLIAFGKENGHMQVPREYSDFSFGRWCGTQRGLFANGKLRAERQKSLEDIGFQFRQLQRLEKQKQHQAFWREQFIGLHKFREKHGHCIVPSVRLMPIGSKKEMKRLSVWVALQRNHYWKGKIDEHDKNMLDEIGFVWRIDPYDAATSAIQRNWDAKFEEIVAYHKKYGSFTVVKRDGQVSVYLQD
jgi:hypothetical protein